MVGLNPDSSYDARLDAYSVIWRYTTASVSGFFFGGGRGTYSLSYADTQWGTELLYGGVTGLIIMLALSFAVIRRSIIVWKKCVGRKDGIGAASVACLVSLSAAVVSEFGLASWSAIRTGETIFILLGVLMAVQRMLWVEEEKREGMISFRNTMVSRQSKRRMTKVIRHAP